LALVVPSRLCFFGLDTQPIARHAKTQWQSSQSIANEHH
jgi:hypothetical protein